MAKQRLTDLERQAKYVFHGSESIVKEFEPRQAYTIVKGQQVSDGEPAVFASIFSDYAIFKAIINKANCPKGFRSGCSYTKGKLEFTATKETLEQLHNNSKGFVHVFNRSDFMKRNQSEWVSYQRIKPIEVIEVQWLDFKSPIKIIIYH